MSSDRHSRTAVSIDAAAVQALRAGVRGALLRPGDEGYEAARTVWNGMIDRKPALIARCTGVADVRSALEFARAHDLRIAIRGGGHNVAGNAVCDGGIVIDLSGMRGVWVDPATRTARVQGGATWGDLDHEGHTFGLATTGGHVSTTGVAGLTLGGGVGWLMRKHGLTCDNLLSAEVVTADGRFLRASAEENSDLFWGLRGGGGNFGVVTSFEFRLHPVSTVLAGMVMFPLATAPAVLRFYREYVADLPDELNTGVIFLTAPPAPFLPKSLHGVGVVAVIVCYAGAIEDGERVLQPLRAFGPSLIDLIQPMPYHVFQTFFDASLPPGLLNYWKSGYMNTLSDQSIETLVAHAGTAPSPQSLAAVLHLGGAVSRVSEDETPVSLRRVPFLLNITSSWASPQDTDRNILWIRDFWSAIQPSTTGGVFVNFLGDEGEDRIRAAYGEAKYQRLVAVKNQYDPTNLFRLNQNIKPTVSAARTV